MLVVGVFASARVCIREKREMFVLGGGGSHSKPCEWHESGRWCGVWKKREREGYAMGKARNSDTTRHHKHTHTHTHTHTQVGRVPPIPKEKATMATSHGIGYTKGSHTY